MDGRLAVHNAPQVPLATPGEILNLQAHYDTERAREAIGKETLAQIKRHAHATTA